MRVETATLQGSGRTNQDAIVVTRRAAAVLDGASSWLPQPEGRDGGWYARELGACLERSLDSSQPIPEIVAEAIATLRDRFDLVPGQSPESTVTIARWDDATVEVYVLGDSPAVLIDQGSNVIEVNDDRLEATVGPERTRYREHLAAGHGYGVELDDLLAKLQRAEQRVRNRPGGYWVAEATPEAALHGLTSSAPMNRLEATLLLTDGASAIAEYESTTGWVGVLGQLQIGGCTGFLSQIHELEKGDPRGRRWPRAKQHDDKSLVCITAC